MKLNKKLIIFSAVALFILIMGIYIFGSMVGSNSLGAMEILLLALICLLFGFILNIFFVIVAKIIKSIS